MGEFWALRYSVAGAFKSPAEREKIPYAGAMVMPALWSRTWGPLFLDGVAFWRRQMENAFNFPLWLSGDSHSENPNASVRKGGNPRCARSGSF